MIQREKSVTGKKLVVQPKQRLEYVPGLMLLRVREGAVRPELGPGRLKITAAETKRLPDTVSEPLDYLRRNAGLKAVHPLFSTQRARIERASMSSAVRGRLAILSSVSDPENGELSGISLLSLDPRKVTPTLMKHLTASAAVQFAEPVPARWLAGAGVDPMQNLQWGLRAIRWFDADVPDASGIRVGVLDTGIDTKHPDLRHVDIEYHHVGLKAQDIVGHGTHVAGIIAATTNNGVGISGIANCKLAAWKIFPDEPISGDFYVDTERYLQALNAAVGAGVKVINLSIGGTASSQTEAILFRRLERQGIIVVAAMGNEYEDGNPKEYPAAYRGVFAVGSVAENGRRSWFSNTGRHIDLLAPGSNILSTLPTTSSPYRDETDFASWSGTSMATPHVVAVAALVAARYPTKDAGQVKKRLLRTTTRLGAMKKRAWTPAYGRGLLNVKKALS